MRGEPAATKLLNSSNILNLASNSFVYQSGLTIYFLLFFPLEKATLIHTV